MQSAPNILMSYKDIQQVIWAAASNGHMVLLQRRCTRLLLLEEVHGKEEEGGIYLLRNFLCFPLLKFGPWVNFSMISGKYMGSRWQSFVMVSHFLHRKWHLSFKPKSSCNSQKFQAYAWLTYLHEIAKGHSLPLARVASRWKKI